MFAIFESGSSALNNIIILKRTKKSESALMIGISNVRKYDKMKNNLGSGVVVLASVQGGRIALIAGVTQDLTDRLDAGQIVNHVAQQVGGKGGGRKDLARAGGDQVDELDGALESVVGFVEKALV